MKDPNIYALFGAAPDTSNQGVSALFRSVLEGVGGAFPGGRLVVFDNAYGVREDSTVLASGADYSFTRVGARAGRRYYLPENLATMAAVARLGRSLGRLHPYIQLLDRCDAILDVSGGDSFSDIYGSKRFLSVARPKLIANYRNIPLVLLPQTYGPFRNKRARRIAREAVLAARMAWARDPRSFKALKDLVDEDFDASRHREGVDMAFTLEAVDPGPKLSDQVRDWVEDSRNQPLVGMNVSGLIALDRHSNRRFGLRASYVDALVRFLHTLMQKHDVRLLLIPHVMTAPGAPESDAEACVRVAEKLAPEFHPRVSVTPTNINEREVKWVISRVQWFCGTRMHSTIAALSSGVPTAALAYSDKTLGVFESCGVGDQVIDPRKLGTHTVIDRLIDSFDSREQNRRILAATIPEVKSRAEEQFRCIVDILKEIA